MITFRSDMETEALGKFLSKLNETLSKSKVAVMFLLTLFLMVFMILPLKRTGVTARITMKVTKTIATIL
ncbi:MAG: hypothetical protein ABFR32_03555 [Bacteroidota bacterium]